MSDEAAYAEILALVHARTGLDFSGYRRSTIARRIRNRMTSVGSATLASYHERLVGSQVEAAALVERLTIKVSRFYRNAPAFDLLRSTVLPELARAAAGAPLRLWSAGCGHGEEAHTLAMLLEEQAMPGEVVATDIDFRALVTAREGLYPDAAFAELPAALRERFVEPGERGCYRVSEGVRRRISWGLDDVAAAIAWPERFDLVCCRNVLIYLDRPSQLRVHSRIAASLAPHGFVMLGEAEWTPHEALGALVPVVPRWRLFRAAAAGELAS